MADDRGLSGGQQMRFPGIQTVEKRNSSERRAPYFSSFSLQARSGKK